jgi:2-polyprenyl-3-methyl-5-hydroxy-6-metoxy-1,4-benzoquinol methylase
MDLSLRSSAPELMDGHCRDYADYRACLRDLARVNTVTLAYRPTLGFLERLRREGRLPSDRALEILDVGSGYGDMLRCIARWAARRGVWVRLTGVDLNPWAVRAAEEATPEGTATFVNGDAYGQPPADVILSSLFTHHLSDAELPPFLAWSERSARIAWFVNDLERHGFSYWGFPILARALGWHRFVRHDGAVSIARSFRPGDWRAHLALAGVDPESCEIRRRFPFRLCVARVKP